MFSYAPEARCATFLCFGKSMRNRRVILVSPPRTTASRCVLGSGLASHAFGFSLKSELLVQQKLRGSPLLYCATIAVLRCVEKLAKIFLSLCRIMDPTFDAQQCRESSRKCWRHFLSQQCNCELFHEIMFKKMFSCASGPPKLCVGKAMQNRRVIMFRRHAPQFHAVY